MSVYKSGALLTAILMLATVVFSTTHGQTASGNNQQPKSHVAPRRNVLLIISDDQGLDTRAYGNPVLKTPNIDRLGQDGVRFKNGFATVASCSPSRAVLMTGLYSHTNGQTGLAVGARAGEPDPPKLYDWVRTVPQILKASGYRTGIIGKKHVAPASAYPFDVDLSGFAVRERNVSGIAQRARQIFEAKDESPFFLVLSYVDPHRDREGFANQNYPQVERITYKPAEIQVPYFLPDRPEVRAELAGYYEAISRLDQGIGMAMKALQESGKLDETLIIFVSDNGMPFPGAKTNLYDSGIHLPLIVRAPNQKKRGVVNNAMASWTDVAPTIFDWTGTMPPYRLPGRSLLPILEQENSSGWDTVFGSHTQHEPKTYYPMRAIRTRRHKLIWNLEHELEYPSAGDLARSLTWQAILRRKDNDMGRRTLAGYLHRPEFELFDLEKDPNELKNVAADPAYAKPLAGLRTKLETMLRETKDPMLAKMLAKQNGKRPA